jgi:hypothetical protein
LPWREVDPPARCDLRGRAVALVGYEGSGVRAHGMVDGVAHALHQVRVKGGG